MTVRLCVVSFKECWQDESGAWWSYGGFPMQIAGVSSLFDETTLVIVRGKPKHGAIPLSGVTRTVALRSPQGADFRRKMSVLANLPYYVGTIAKHVRDADVVHTPTPGDMPLLGMLIALMFRKRLIVRYGSSWVTTSQTTLTHRFTRACMRRFAGGRNVMLATGEGRQRPAGGIQWVFATALSKAELSGIRPCLNRGLSERPRLVYVGRLSPEKGVATLVRALAMLKDDMRPVPELTLVGDGPERRALERLVDEVGCGACVRFAGHCNREELSFHLMHADICVQPSLTEGFSKAWLDAMAYGLPVIASRVGAAEAVIGEGDHDARGWLVPPGDARQLAASIRQAVETPRDWAALRRRCRAYVETRTLEAWVRQIGDVCAMQWNMSVVGGKLRP